MESPDNTVALETPNNTLTTDKLEEEEFEFDEKEFSNLTDSNGNLNISEISADEVSLSHRSLGHFKSKKKWNPFFVVPSDEQLLKYSAQSR